MSKRERMLFLLTIALSSVVLLPATIFVLIALWPQRVLVSWLLLGLVALVVLARIAIWLVRAVTAAKVRLAEEALRPGRLYAHERLVKHEEGNSYEGGTPLEASAITGADTLSLRREARSSLLYWVNTPEHRAILAVVIDTRREATAAIRGQPSAFMRLMVALYCVLWLLSQKEQCLTCVAWRYMKGVQEWARTLSSSFSGRCEPTPRRLG